MTMSMAVSVRDNRFMGGAAHRLRARAAGGGHEYMRQRLVANGEVLLASKTRMGREGWARSQWRYRLRHADGSYVNMDLSGTTMDVRGAWIGFAGQLETVRSRRPDLADFRTIELPPAGKKGIVP